MIPASIVRENVFEIPDHLSYAEAAVVEPLVSVVHAADIIGIQPGEKLHEQMISKDENNNTFEYPNYFKILPQTNTPKINKLFIKRVALYIFAVHYFITNI